MKLLLFSDLHCNTNAAAKLVEQARDADVVVGAGDFATMHEGLQETIDALKRIACPAVLVPGNSETVEELQDACGAWPSAHVLHGNGVEIGGVAFFGIGGGIPVTPFGSWSYDFTEEQAADLLRDCPDGCVLVSHSPPKGAADIASNGKSLGSTTVADTIRTRQPKLVACGHIHESAGKQAELHGVPVINAGPRGMMFEL